MDTFSGKIAKTLLIILDKLISVRSCIFDALTDWQRLDY
jgi:hypothetical protein